MEDVKSDTRSQNCDGRGEGVEDASTTDTQQGCNISVLKYLTSELTRGYLLERDESKYTERRERVYTFMKTPRELEKFCMYGFFQCLDAFLFIFTFLPVRIFMALIRLFTHPCGIFSSGSQHYLESAQICDLLKGTILIVCSFVIGHIDTSMMYHLVRGQSVIKLYVFYNMLDVCDRLFSGFGQDILDALFWTATEPKGKKREHVGVLPHLVLAIIYVLIHTMLILSQATVLNVAFNSHNKALLTIMMSNNFVEIKGSLFKRVDKSNLFQISCSDVKERFHYCILLGIVFIRNMTEFNWDPDHLNVILPDVIVVLVAELVVDWIKHAFVTKFNEISSDVYSEFTINLVQDMVTSRQKHAFTDHSDQVSRRMGFTPIPLACLVFRIISKSIKISGPIGILIVVVSYFCLLTLKVLTSIILLGHGSRLLSSQTANSKKPAKTQEIDSQKIPKKESRHAKFEKSTTPDTSPSPEPDLVAVDPPEEVGPVESGECDKLPGSSESEAAVFVDCSREPEWVLSSPSNPVTLRQCKSDSNLMLYERIQVTLDEAEAEVDVDVVVEEDEDMDTVSQEAKDESPQVSFQDIGAGDNAQINDLISNDDHDLVSLIGLEQKQKQ